MLLLRAMTREAEKREGGAKAVIIAPRLTRLAAWVQSAIARDEELTSELPGQAG